ncbi:MAG: hypothetical protein Q8K78_13260, partial [Planctomycetaceae bacterium]|nr:hypothetical protein [Planctomycetaceae bacterium]
HGCIESSAATVEDICRRIATPIGHRDATSRRVVRKRSAISEGINGSDLLPASVVDRRRKVSSSILRGNSTASSVIRKRVSFTKCIHGRSGLASRIEHGLLINFGAPKLQIKKLALLDDYPQSLTDPIE